MSDGATTVLGLASRGDEDRLSVWLVEVQLGDDGTVAVAVYERWRATKGRDEASQLIDAHDTVRNALDSPQLGAATAVAVKRVESPPGRPGNPYDRRVRFEGAAMLAAHVQNKRYFQYRSNQLGRGAAITAKAHAAPGAPSDDGPREALAAACTALGDLGEMRAS